MKRRIEGAEGMKETTIEAIKELIRSIPEDENGQRNIGEALEDAFERAGFHLECHQQGIRGTMLIAVAV